MSVSERVRFFVRTTNRPQCDIAAEVGISPGFLSQVISGDAKLPVHRAPALAKATGDDPKELLRACLAEYHPEILPYIAGQQLTAKEAEFLKAVRQATGDSDPSVFELLGMLEK